MTHRIVKFEPWHLMWLGREGPPMEGSSGIQPSWEVADRCAESGPALSVFSGGLPIASGGSFEIWPGRHILWGYYGQQTKGNMYLVAKAALTIVESCKGRVETTVRADFKMREKWMRILGMHIESPLLERYDPEGNNHVGYVRFN